MQLKQYDHLRPFDGSDLAIDERVGPYVASVVAHNGFLLPQYSVLILVLCLDLYVLGDDSSISYGSFMRTKHLCVLIHIRIKGEVGTAKHDLGPPVKYLY